MRLGRHLRAPEEGSAVETPKAVTVTTVNCTTTDATADAFTYTVDPARVEVGKELNRQLIVLTDEVLTRRTNG